VSGLAWAVATCAAQFMFLPAATAQYPATSQVSKDGTSVQLTDYATLPLSNRTGSSPYPPPINYGSYLGRPNFLRSEPAGAPLDGARLFVCDMNRSLYILDRTSRLFSNYINFEEVFPRFINPIFGCGLITFVFDPAYASNGRFYTVHTETDKNAFYIPVTTNLPGLNTNGYTPTAVIAPPTGTILSESVVVEWTDSNISNGTFEGTARELLRVGYTTQNHPIGDLAFNPQAQPGDADYGNLYLVAGDDIAGESTGSRHTIPQRLDVLHGKVLRLTPDLSLRTNDLLSANGRYRIPSSGTETNPFVSVVLADLKKEIFAYGFRNPHRLSWDAVTGKLIVTDIGQNSWEEINFVTGGNNHGYAEREGMEQFFASDDTTGSQRVPVVPFPSPDSLSVTGLASVVSPKYPVAAYSHRDGDGVCGGFVYHGSLMPALRGKYVSGDITCGRIFYCDLTEMTAADDGDRLTLAPVRELQIVVNGVKRRVFDIVSAKYHERGGTANALPGGCNGLVTGGNDPEGVAYGCGRADIRLAQDGDGELYLLSKSDGMVRQFSASLIPPSIRTVGVSNGVVTLDWLAISNRTYRVQFKTVLTESNWTDLAGDVTATGVTASKTDPAASDARYYRLIALP
jgi:hypothetical protein